MASGGILRKLGRKNVPKWRVVDVIFFQALALTLSTDLVFIPVFGESACVNGMFTLIKGADIRNLLHFFLDILKKEDFSVVIFNLLCQILKFWRIQS